MISILRTVILILVVITIIIINNIINSNNYNNNHREFHVHKRKSQHLKTKGLLKQCLEGIYTRTLCSVFSLSSSGLFI